MPIPIIVLSISDNQTSSHQCSSAMLVCLFILLVHLNPSSVNLDRAVSLCGSLYTLPRLVSVVTNRLTLQTCSESLTDYHDLLSHQHHSRLRVCENTHNISLPSIQS